MNWPLVYFQVAASAVYGASAQTNTVLPPHVADLLIELFSRSLEEMHQLNYPMGEPDPCGVARDMHANDDALFAQMTRPPSRDATGLLEEIEQLRTEVEHLRRRCDHLEWENAVLRELKDRPTWSE